MQSLLRIHFKASKKQARRSLDSETLKGMLTLCVSFPINTTLMMALPWWLFFGRPIHITHVHKEVAQLHSTHHSLFPEIRAQVKSLLSMTESWCWGMGWLTHWQEWALELQQGARTILLHSGHLPIKSRCLNTCRNQALGIQVTCGLWGTGLLFLDY